MRHVTVVTDSNVCLPASLVNDLGICVLPITVHLPGADHRDGEAGLSESVYQALDDHQAVTSSPPSVAEYLQAIEEAETEAVVVVTPATEFTSMHTHAALACDLARRRAIAVDCRTATAGQGLVVLAGARACQLGAALEGVVRAVEDAAGRADLVASVAELQTLSHRGWVPADLVNPPVAAGSGREGPRTHSALDAGLAISGVAAGSGREGPRTLFRFRAGCVEPLEGVSSATAAIEAIYDQWSQAGGPNSERSVVFHADEADLAARLGDRLERVSFVSGFSAAMGIHTGRGVVGAAWLRAER